MRGYRWIIAGCLLAAACGCDEKPALAPAGTAPTSPGPSRPTTQQILDTPLKPLVLGSYPLILDVPEGLWQLKILTSETPGATTLSLEGPAPSSDVMIEVSHYSVVQPADTLIRREADALKELQAHPDTVFVDELRPLGKAKVLERRAVDTEMKWALPFTSARFKLSRQLAIEYGDMDWSLRVFTPHPVSKPGDTPVYDYYMLNFVTLTHKQYLKDQAFLEKIIQSLRYDPLAGEMVQ